MTKMTYHNKQNIEHIEKLRELLEELPKFMSEYFRGASRISSGKTRLAYAYDMKVFFKYICQNNSKLNNKQVTQLELSDMAHITSDDIEFFLEFVTYYESKSPDGTIKTYANKDATRARKLCAVKSVFKYFHIKRKIEQNPCDFVIAPKIKEKNITVLEPNEVALLMDYVESGEKLTNKQKIYHEYTCKRDLALVALMLGTGIRVSECVGIDIDDIDFDLNGVKIVRKGGNESVVYFNDEVRELLLDYLKIRVETPSKDASALFLSLHKKRINVRTVQALVKKYAQTVTHLKNITPHKLRSTYATGLYKESGDIYLVADALGHKNVNTTQKRYAKIDDERRKRAATFVHLRNDN